MSGPEDRLRPHPSERLTGPAVLLRLPEFARTLDAEPHPAPRGHRQVSLAHRGPLRLVLFTLDAGSELPEHRAPGHVVIHCLEGQLEVGVAGRVERLGADDALLLDPDVPHTVKAPAASRMLLTVCLEPKPAEPPRADSPITAHYGRPGIVEAIDAALVAAGKSAVRLRAEDLAPVDNFHLRGLEATRELARLAGVTGTDEVLDIGGGIGGPARVLAADFGCRITVLDLTPEFCQAGEALTRRMGLDDRVRFQVGDAVRPPFSPDSFDLVWTQHSSMNIADKPGLYAAARRMLRRGGRLAIHEIMGGPGGPIDFPVPWASHAELSFLLPADEVRGIIRDSGFHERAWVDVTAASLAWIDERLAATERPPLGPHVLLGEAARLLFENLRRGLAEDRVRVIEAVFE